MPLQGKSQSNREKILSNVSKALQNGAVAMPFPDAEKNVESTFVKQEKDLTENFAVEFTNLGGKFIYCLNEQEMLENLVQIADKYNWKHVHCLDNILANYYLENGLDFIKNGNELSGLDAGISTCELLIARTGSIILSSALPSGRVLPVYNPVHIAIAYANQIVWDVADGLSLMQHKYKNKLPSMMSLTTGPSRTADIEKTLVVGVHGPKEVYVIFIDKNTTL